jgi:hypothetical protein
MSSHTPPTSSWRLASTVLAPSTSQGPRTLARKPESGRPAEPSPTETVEAASERRKALAPVASGLQPQLVIRRSLAQTISTAAGWAQAATESGPTGGRPQSAMTSMLPPIIL